MKQLPGIRSLSLWLAGIMLLAITGSADDKTATSSANPRLETRRLLRAADASCKQGEMDNALASLDSVLAIDSSNPDGYYLKGKITLMNGDSAAAIEILNEASQVAPRSTRIKLLLARIHLNKGSWEEPLTLTENVLAIKPMDGEASYLRGWGLLLQGDTAQATKIFETVLAKELDTGE
jgi:tetratricopeptide (TPR) repeat protein